MKFTICHQSKYQGKILLFLFITILCPFSIPKINFALDAEYEKNGEIYILTTDTSSRGVYRLNNLDNQNTQDEDDWAKATFLYDPLECRGIKVSNARNIYTFGHDETGWKTDGIRHDVQVQWNGVSPGPGSYYGDHAWHHAWHGTCKESNCLPFADLDGSKNYQIAIRGTNYGKTGWYNIKNGLWYHSLVPNSARTGNLCLQDIVKRKYHNYNLYEWQESVQGLGNPAKIKQAGVATSFQEIKTRNILNGCHDGCGVDDDSIPLSAIEYITDVTISLTGNTPHTYFYIRADKTGSTGKILKDGATVTSATETIIGNPDNSTSKFLGVSSKSSSDDYIYILGNYEIKKWLREVNFSTSGVNIDKIAVSDMWWQTGGMIFALDSENKKVYKFERNEKSSTSAAPMSILIPDNVTDITSDGFGNLYFANTIKYPSGTPPIFTGRDVQYSSLTWVEEGTNEWNAEVTYLQGVEKTVWKRNYYNGMTTKVGKVRVGTIPWRARVKYIGSNTPKNEVTWLSEAATISNITTPVIRGDFDTNALAEIAAINLASPPQVKGFKEGHIDICGPYEYNDAGTANIATLGADETTGYEGNKIYQFRVENFPWFDDYGVNTNSDLTLGDDKNGNGFTGGFVSTIAKNYSDGSDSDNENQLPGILYTWKIIKTVDRNGHQVPLSKQTMLEPVKTPNPILNYLFDGGKYTISVSANFHWYDYDKMPAGSLFSERRIVASFNEKAANVSGGNIAENYVPFGVTAECANDIVGFSPNKFLTFGSESKKAWATIQIMKFDGDVLKEGNGEIAIVDSNTNTCNSEFPNSKIKGYLKNLQENDEDKQDTDVPVFIVDQDATPLLAIKEKKSRLDDQILKNAGFNDRVKLLCLDDSHINTEDTNTIKNKKYYGKLSQNKFFENIIKNDPLIAPYTKAGNNKLPTIRWKNAWNETNGNHLSNVGPNVKWTWELKDSADKTIIYGENNYCNSTPEFDPKKEGISDIWAIPSAPGLYSLKATINRTYVYITFEEVGAKYNPSTGTTDKITKEVEHAENIMFDSYCYVYVIDKSAPALINPYDGSGINPHFYIYTGQNINNCKRNPSASLPGGKIEIYIEENNPFDNGIKTPLLTANRDVKWNSGMIPKEFSINENQAGMVNHETAIYKLNTNNLPKTFKIDVASLSGSTYEAYFASTADKLLLNEPSADGVELEEWLQTQRWKTSYSSKSGGDICTNNGGVEKFKNTDSSLKAPGDPNTVSITKFTVDIFELNRFSKPFDANAQNGLENTFPDITASCVPYYHASNASDSSDDYKVFFRYRDSSGNISAPYDIANIEVLDNNPPNIFVGITDRTKAEMTGIKNATYVPSHVKDNYMKYFFIDEIPKDNDEKLNITITGHTIIDNNDWIYNEGASEQLTPSNNSSTFPNAILKAPELGGGTIFTHMLFPNVVEDNRIKFEVFAQDNVPVHFGGSDSPQGEVDVSDLLDDTNANSPDICMYVVKKMCTIDDIKNGNEKSAIEIDFKAPQETGATVTTIKNINFREPGEYYLVGYVRDRAPLTSRDGNFVNPTPNRRNFRFKLEIKDTAINVHTLESK